MVSTSTPTVKVARKAKRSAAKAKYSVPVVLAYFKDCGLPEAVVEFKFHPTRKWASDFAFLKERILLECDGGVWTKGAHGSGAGIIRDMDKGNAAQALGYSFLRVLPENLCMSETVELIKETIKNKTTSCTTTTQNS
jgi:very-short-patch-repair endonuclease